MATIDLYRADAQGVVGPSAMEGALPHCIAATVRREINGEYSLTADFPAAAQELELMTLGRAIRATVNETGEKQYFIIKNRRRNLTGGISVYAEHPSYSYNGVVLNAGAANPNGIVRVTFAAIQTYARPSITGISTWTYSRASGLRANFPERPAPMPVAEVLKRYLIEAAGGELIFNGLDVEYVDAMGADHGAEFRYGTNLTGLESEDILDGYASGIYPYWGSPGDADRPLTVLSGGVYNYSGSYPMQVIVPVDFNQLFDTQPTQEQMLAACQEYEALHAPSGVPASLRVSRARILGDVPVDLGDTVTLAVSPWKIKTKTRIHALTFDALRERVIDAQLGAINPGFAGAVRNMR